jgi:catechol 2,3-dioxygenase-like lactoylglutathione lyase family enzyme
MSFRVDDIDHVALTVHDRERSAAWYRDMLGLERRYEDAWGDEPLVMCAATTCVALFPAEDKRPAPVPGHDTIAMRHLAFRLSREDFERAHTELADRGLAPEYKDHGIAWSIYVHDPDGHLVELTTYERRRDRD